MSYLKLPRVRDAYCVHGAAHWLGCQVCSRWAKEEHDARMEVIRSGLAREAEPDATQKARSKEEEV